LLEVKGTLSSAMANFTVDTHLFRELGKLLVGRDSTALVELIKNAYDADATEVTVHGEQLEHLERGCIIVKDNGSGMTKKQFEDGFLRIASRIKDEGERRSDVFERRYTGAKGVGRLAAHKLASLLRVTSVPRKSGQHMIEATIDWNEVEKRETLDELEGTKAVIVHEIERPAGAPHGTTIRLERLRERWTPAARQRFQQEVASFQPPPVVFQFDTEKLVGGSILRHLDTRDVQTAGEKAKAEEFICRLENELAEEDDYWDVVADVADWVIEIDAREATVRYAVIPTKRHAEELRKKGVEASRCVVKGKHPEPSLGPFFQARILVRIGAATGDAKRKSWLGRMSNIWVFMEGFRVLPYGDGLDDWLNINAAYARRDRSVSLLDELVGAPPPQEDEGLNLSQKQNYFGCVFLTQEKSQGLQMLVNREGFLPNDSFEALRQVVQTALNLSVRHRAAVSAPLRNQRGQEREQANASEDRRTRLELSAAVERAAKEATEMAHQARAAAASGKYDDATKLITEAAQHFRESSETHNRLLTERATMHVLASLGLEMTKLVHEVRGLLGILSTLDEMLNEFRQRAELSPAERKQLAAIHGNIAEARRIVERQAAYLTDVSAPDSRRRRSRQKLAERFTAAERLFETQIAKLKVEVSNEIPIELKTPAIFPAEVLLALTNLLSNAVKAAGEGGKILAKGELSEKGTVVFRLENTGVRVDLSEGERWFRPFETTTAEVDTRIGQGMGMGLPITRNMLEEYGATVRFVTPSRGFSTAIEVRFGD